jgi:hypothetical protein
MNLSPSATIPTTYCVQRDHFNLHAREEANRRDRR